MILQALTRLYEDLADRGVLERPGWTASKISYALCINSDGTLTHTVPLMVEVQMGKKTVLRPREINLPAAVKRSSKVTPNFLWDNCAYILGIDSKGKPERARKCFDACREHHHALLDNIPSPTAEAILRFFDSWNPEEAQDDFRLADCIDDLMKGANLLFRVNGTDAQCDPLIRDAWNQHYNSADGIRMQCLVSGQTDVIEAVHPAIKGVAGAQSSGAALVSFNAPAFCSYGKEQNFNAPVGKYAAFAYTTALNHLLSDRENVQHIGDTTVVCWAEGADPVYTGISCAALFGSPAPAGLTDAELRSTVKRLAEGLPCRELNLDPKRPFYILGLAPNAARLSVRFFHRDSFGSIMRHINEHHERLEITGSFYQTLPLWAMLRETVNPHASDKTPSPAMSGATARAIFSGTRYPFSLLEAVTIRIRAERNITPGRAAIIKAFYLNNPSDQCPKEVLTVALNQDSTNIPYNLGRLFYLYEQIQEEANPGINATIKDKYFNSASATPATIFPILDNLCQKHLRKLKPGLRTMFDIQICHLKERLEESYPIRMTLPEQGSFNLGYYHQKQFRYTKKEEQ